MTKRVKYLLAQAAFLFSAFAAAASSTSLHINLGPAWDEQQSALVPGSDRKVIFYSKNSKTADAEELNVAEIPIAGNHPYNDIVTLIYNPGKSALQDQGCQLVDIASVPAPFEHPLQKFGYYLQCKARKLGGFDMYMLGATNMLYFISYRIHGFPVSEIQQQEMLNVLSAIQVCDSQGGCFAAGAVN